MENFIITLTPQQWDLYELIKHNSLIERRKTTQKEICDIFPNAYAYVDRPNSTDKCTQIWVDIQAINESPNLEKFIITERYEYWIGSERECKRYLKRLWNSISPRLLRFQNVVRKMKADGQGKIIGASNLPIDDNSKARRFIEAFNEYDLEMMEEKESVS